MRPTPRGEKLPLADKTLKRRFEGADRGPITLEVTSPTGKGGATYYSTTVGGGFKRAPPAGALRGPSAAGPGVGGSISRAPSSARFPPHRVASASSWRHGPGVRRSLPTGRPGNRARRTRAVARLSVGREREPQALEDGLGGVRWMDRCEEPHATAAARALLHVHREDAPQEVRPGEAPRAGQRAVGHLGNLGRNPRRAGVHASPATQAQTR